MYSMPVGLDNFREMIAREYYFVDKTKFIKELLDSNAMVTLITRPRRFGKTLAMRMLQEFFDINAAGRDTFKGLNISRAGEKYMQHRGKYPVIFLQLKNVAAGDFEKSFAFLKAIIARLYREYAFLEESPALTGDEKEYYVRVRRGREHCTYDDLAMSLGNLTDMLYRHYGIRPIVLIDEYDAPIQHAWEDGYYEDMIRFMRQFYSEVLKGNEALEFAVLTGVLRVAKESIFSGLNNLKVCSVLSGEYSDIFGFTGEEVAKMAVDLQQEDKLPEIKAWYDGYTFGGTEIYNPWSVIMYFDAGCKPAPYWVNTSGNGIVKQMFKFSGQEGADDLQSLMDGGSVFKQLREGVVYANIGDRIDDLYSILLMTGYLKCVGLMEKLYGEEAELRIPNKEIRSLFGREILENFIAAGSVSRLGRMLDAMVSGHGDIFESVLSGIVRNNVSYHDAANGESF